MPEPSAPSAATARMTSADGTSSGSCARPSGAISTAAHASWPMDTCSGGKPRIVRPAYSTEAA